MNFIVDAQLPKSLADFLTAKGHLAIHTTELEKRNRTSDIEIIELAEKLDMVVITKDLDFFQSHVIYKIPAKLLFVKTGNISNAALLILFDRLLLQIVNYLEDYSLIELYTDELIVQ